MNAEPSSSDSVSDFSGISAQAEAWVRRRDAGLSPGERQHLRAWLTAHPRHAEAFAAADRTRTELDWPLHADATDEIVAGLEQRVRQRRHRRRAMAATGALAVAIIAIGLAWRRPALHMPAATARSALLVVVGPRSQALPDGSTVQLKDNAAIRIDFSGPTRQVTLTRGTAHFAVVKDPVRPFVVEAGGVAVRAVGTAFCVELDAREITVVVTEGRVAVNQPAAGTTAPRSEHDGDALAVVDVGKFVVVPIEPQIGSTKPAVLSLAAAELAQRLAWRMPRLEFSGTPLAEVVATINRHNTAQFVIADRALEKLVLSGVLRADRVDALVAMLESDFQVKVERRGDQVILRRASAR